MTDPVLRQIRMLSMIPSRPHKITVRALHEKLATYGLSVHRRGVERDLKSLSAIFPLITDEAKPAGWSWIKNAEALQIPAMDPGTALTMQLVERYLKPLLPRVLMKQLEPSFAHASNVLDSHNESSMSRWSKRIAAVSSGQLLLPPDISPEVSQAVSQALLERRQFDVSYRARANESPKRYPLHPLGLVLRAGILYLVASASEYSDVRHFALHRMTRPVLLDAPLREPVGFDFERYLQDDHAFEYPLGAMIKVELRVDSEMCRLLEESRLSSDQKTRAIRGSDDVRVNATVADTEQLRWWLRSLGESVEVIKPTSLRHEMAAVVAALAKRYGRRALQN